MNLDLKTSLFLDDRIRGSYAYMVLCQDDGPIYIKIGMSDSPYRRFLQLRSTCEFTPRRMSFVHVRTRDHARALEADLLDEFADCRIHGEWIKLDPADKKDFNRRWQKVFARHATKNWPLRWDQVSASGLVKMAERRQRAFKKCLSSGISADEFAAATGDITV